MSMYEKARAVLNIGTGQMLNAKSLARQVERDYAPRVTDSNEDGTPAITFEPWTDGHAVGFKVTRHVDNAVSFAYLNPSQDTMSDGKLNPDVFVYVGTCGNPSADTPLHFYNIDFA